MAKHDPRSFSESLISGNVEPFPLGWRNGGNGDPGPADARADGFVVLAVVAFVIGFLSLFAFAASRQAPESFAKDTSLLTMYGP